MRYTISMVRKSFLLFALVAIPLFSFATVVHVGNPFFLKGSETRVDDMYIVAPSSSLVGKVEGDVFSVSHEIFSQGDITEDVLFVGERVRLLGEVHDDARIAGAMITLDGKVGDDAVLIGSSVLMGSDARIGGNLYLLGGEVKVDGRVMGKAFIVGHQTHFAGTIEGDVEVWGDFTFAEKAIVKGDLIYHSSKEITLPSGAIIEGNLIFDQMKEGTRGTSFLPGMLSGVFSIQILMNLALGFFLFFLVKERTEEVLHEVSDHFLPRVVRGLLIAFLVPFFSILLLLSVVGLPLAVIFLSLFASGFILALSGAGLLLGVLIERKLFKQESSPLSFRAVLLGNISLALVSVIPYIGLVTTLVISLALLGSTATVFYTHLREPR